MLEFKQAQDQKAGKKGATTQQEPKKKGNNLKWINKVRGKGGDDGRMDEGTVTAAEMAGRYSFFSFI